MDITPSVPTPISNGIPNKVILICAGIALGIALGYWLSGRDDIKTYLYGWKLGSEYGRNKAVMDSIKNPTPSDVANAPTINSDTIAE